MLNQAWSQNGEHKYLPLGRMVWDKRWVMQQPNFSRSLFSFLSSVVKALLEFMRINKLQLPTMIRERFMNGEWRRTGITKFHWLLMLARRLSPCRRATSIMHWWPSPRNVIFSAQFSLHMGPNRVSRRSRLQATPTSHAAKHQYCKLFLWKQLHCMRWLLWWCFWSGK